MLGIKYKTPDELWDRCQKKLIVYGMSSELVKGMLNIVVSVMEGVSLVTKSGMQWNSEHLKKVNLICIRSWQPICQVNS